MQRVDFGVNFVHYLTLFTFNEQYDKVNMKELEIAKTALQAFENQTKVKGKWKPTPNQPLDGVMDFYFTKNKTQRFTVEIKKEIRNHNLPGLLDKATRYKNLMVIAENIFPKIKEQLQLHNIAYLETNGNAFLRKNANYFIWIDHHKPKTTVKEVNRAFTKTGLKVIFLFLTDETYINRPYREIADKAEVALGNVNIILNGLKALRLLVRKNDQEFLLPDKKALLEKWIGAYGERLKPTIHQGNYRFLNNEDFFNWQNIKINTDKTLWGGEPAGDLYTANLNPEILTVYTVEGRAELMKNYRLVPDEHGKVHVYKKFWKTEMHDMDKAVPPVLAYTDLINTGNQRCIDTAQTIYEKHLKNEFE